MLVLLTGAGSLSSSPHRGRGLWKFPWLHSSARPILCCLSPITYNIQLFTDLKHRHTIGSVLISQLAWHFGKRVTGNELRFVFSVSRSPFVMIMRAKKARGEGWGQYANSGCTFWCSTTSMEWFGDMGYHSPPPFPSLSPRVFLYLCPPPSHAYCSHPSLCPSPPPTHTHTCTHTPSPSWYSSSPPPKMPLSRIWDTFAFLHRGARVGRVACKLLMCWFLGNYNIPQSPRKL